MVLYTNGLASLPHSIEYRVSKLSLFRIIKLYSIVVVSNFFLRRWITVFKNLSNIFFLKKRHTVSYSESVLTWNEKVEDKKLEFLNQLMSQNVY